MTREEAITDIRDNIKPIVGGKSLDMAIKALEQEPCEDETRPLVSYLHKGMPHNKVEQIAYLLLNGCMCEFCKVCRDKPCNLKEGESCTANIADYIRKIVHDEQKTNVRIHFCPNCGKAVEEEEEAYYDALMQMQEG